MYLLPSTSTIVAPDAFLMKSGDPPTDLNARTGLSTPPGSSCCAREKSLSDRFVFIGVDGVTLSERPAQRDCRKCASLTAHGNRNPARAAPRHSHAPPARLARVRCRAGCERPAAGCGRAA